MKELFKNPFSIWLSWFIKRQKVVFKNRNKNFNIGYRSYASDCNFGSNVTIYENVSLCKVSAGNFSYINNQSKINRTTIGNFCSIGENVRCGLGLHPSKTFVSTHPSFYSKSKFPQITFAENDYFTEYAEIQIGNDVWVGSNSIIIDGVKIEDGAIIAAGSVVTKDVPPYAIVGGNPAKIIRFRFEENQINQLLKIQWWNKSTDWCIQNHKLMHNIESFLNNHSKI